MQAYAVEVIPENFQAIVSEAGDRFDFLGLNQWYDHHGCGYFLRDEESPFDCQLIHEDIFRKLYRFKFKTDDSLFKEVVSKPTSSIF